MNNKYFTIGRWKYNYEVDSIEVFNGLGACHLAINGQICDMKEGYTISRANLSGKLSSGKTVTAKYTNIVAPKCSVFVDGELLTPESDNE